MNKRTARRMAHGIVAYLIRSYLWGDLADGDGLGIPDYEKIEAALEEIEDYHTRYNDRT